MESHLTEEALWANNMASRLRLIQANFADDPPSTRQTFLAEEVERGLQGVAPSKRETYLDALSQKFPSWEAARPAEGGEASVAPPPEAPEPLLARLIEAAPALSSEARLEFGRRLQQAGFGSALPAANPFSGLSLDLQKKLGLAPDKTLDPDRVVKMLAGLLELVLVLDQLVWTLWRQLARQPKYQKEAEFSKLAGPYLAGDPEVPTQLVAQPLEKTRRLIAALLGAVGRASSTYAKKHVARFAPEVIEDFAKMEKKWNESLDFACWRKYRELYKEHATEPAIENELQDSIAKSAENLILGRAAS
jgi:hypothetical protein